MKYKYLNQFITTIKGEKFILNNEIPRSYILSLVVNRIVMLLRFIVVFRRLKFSFMGTNCTIKCKSKIRFGNSLSIANNCYIDALSTNGIILGNNVSFGKYTIIECSGSVQNIGKGLIIEDNVGLGSNSFLGSAGGILIKSNTIMGNYVSFHSENHKFDKLDVPIRLQGVCSKGIEVGENCWVGAKVTILDGVKINSGSIIAAGAVVIAGEYPKNSILAGVPAKVVKIRENK